MRNESGKSIVILIIMTILIVIGASVIINYAKEMMKETQAQDLRTNMLLIEAEAKKGLEEVCFKTVNLNIAKQEDLTQINEAKQENLAGTLLSEAPAEVQEASKNVTNFTFDENCYYLDEATLNQMGIKDINEKEDGYIIVQYNFSNADVEVINTKGYDGKYTLTQIIKTTDEGQS